MNKAKAKYQKVILQHGEMQAVKIILINTVC